MTRAQRKAADTAGGAAIAFPSNNEKAVGRLKRSVQDLKLFSFIVTPCDGDESVSAIVRSDIGYGEPVVSTKLVEYAVFNGTVKV